MSGFSRNAAVAVLIAAASIMAACSSSGSSDSASAAPPAATSTPAQAYSDAQVQAFVAARTELQAAGANADQARVSQILQSHNITPTDYNAIQTRAQTDQTLANRISAAAVGTDFTDAQLQSFIAASAAIDPINRTLATATPEQRTEAATQIRTILQQNNLTFEQYNGIAARAQADQTLAARINALRAPAAPADATTEQPATSPQ
jgi:hypothetical protein